MVEVREATEADREALAFIEGFSFNAPVTPEDVPVAGVLCAVDHGNVVGMAGVRPLGQWFGGAKVPCAGIDDVAVIPEHRGRGLAVTLMRQLLARQRDAGDAISTLYPANSQLYRRLGYEYAGLRPRFLVPIADLPASRGDVEVVDTSDVAALGPLTECFHRYARAHNGPVQSADTAWWAMHALAHKGQGIHQRTVAVPGRTGLEGYASYFTEYDGERRGLVAACKHLIALSGTALGTLLGYFRRFENSARYLGWCGPPSTTPVGLAASSNGFSVVPTMSRWMTRILDVPRALEERGYPAGVEASFSFSVEDPLFPANAGPWEVIVSGARAKVGRPDGGLLLDAPGRPIPVGLFAALYTGLAGPIDLVAMGALDLDDPRLGVLAAVFGGPTPWMPDEF